MIKQCCIIFGCLAIGELIVYLTGIKLPSSIIGMLLLTFLLKIKVIKLQWVKGISSMLIENMGFFFIPAGVALMLYFNIIKANLTAIVLASVISTIIVLALTGWVHQALRKTTKHINSSKNDILKQ